MQKSLEYTLPLSIKNLLKQLNLTKNKKAIDLGCGTGLCGIIMREFSEYLIGIDISTKMLAQAKNKKIYDLLITAEATSFLQHDQQNYQLAIAADMLPYFGELNTLFTVIQKSIVQDGVFIFSHEICENQPWILQKNARFSHNPTYIELLCQKYAFKIIYKNKVVARQQNKQALAVMLYAIQREN